ncbi:MAG: glycosyltransferase family 4 protein [Anaerolineae bacterium]
MMNILVCSSQVPFERGGAEMLAESLVAALQARGHRADLVALPFKWYPKSEILKSALAWRLVNLIESDAIHVDRLIATKFPSYTARHPHKVVWLVHQLRQVYDWYQTPLSDFGDAPADQKVRQQIIELDRRALGEARARFAISKNVAARLARFNGLNATPLYPPPRLTGRFRSGEYGDSILYVGRLDRAKRVDLLIRALAHTRHGRAVIAGTGPEAAPLQDLARACGVASRVEFAGYVDDECALALYASARAVYYAPVDEDYGFATVEAYLSERPVITTGDAGGVLEFVDHEIDGLVTPPEPQALAESIARVLEDEGRCRTWGRAGHERVKDITWDRVIDALV